MALIDVSKMVTVFQRLCQFAEEFTNEYRESLVEALTEVFSRDLEEGQPAPDVFGLVNSLIRRLRGTLDNLTQAETELIGAFKANTAFRGIRDRLVKELRVVFELSRAECRTHFGRERSDAAGFPARIADDPGALLRQIKLVSWTLRNPDFDLGEARIPGSVTTNESVLAIYEPKAEELRGALADAVRRKTRIEGKQVAKNKEMKDFETTYSLFVNMLRSSFRLGGQTELANRMTLTQRRRAAGQDSEVPGQDPADSEIEPGEAEPGEDETNEAEPNEAEPNEAEPNQSPNVPSA